MARRVVGATLTDVLNEIKTDVRSQRDTLTHVLTVLERQQAALDEHVRRSETNEKAIDVVRAELAPLKTHAAVWGALAKILAALGVLVSIAVGVVKIMGVSGG